MYLYYFKGPCNSNVKYNALVDGGILANTSQNCYELIKQSVTWDQAEKKCNQHGGHLAEIDDQTEQDFVQQFLLIQDPTQAVWIGLNDQQQEDVFAWTSGI